MTAEEFIDRLDGRGSLSPDAIASLRQFVAKSLKIVTPESLANLLIEKKWLTAAQAKQLLHVPPPVPARPVQDEFSLAPLDDEPRKMPTAAPKTTKADKAPAAKPTAAAVKPKAAAKPAATAAKPAAATSASPAKPGKGAAKPPPKSSGLGSDFGLPFGGAGPLDDFFGDSTLGQSPGGFDSGPLAVSTAPRRSSSKMIWIALGGAVFAVVYVIALVVVLGRSNGDSEFTAAEKDFAAGSDRDAIAKLDSFLEKFPNHPRASGAAVDRSIARFRQAAASKTDWVPALSIAREVLPKAVDQPDFTKAREIVVKILPQMAVGLVKQAKDGAAKPLDQRKRLADAAAEALAMARDPRYTPDSTKPWTALAAAENDLAPLLRAVDRQTEFDRAAGEIHSAVAAGDAKGAMVRLDNLLLAWPELNGDDAFAALEQELAEANLKSAKIDKERHKAETKPRQGPAVSTVVYAALGENGGTKQPTAPTDSPACAVLFRGTAYFIESAHGMLLGRTFLGFESGWPLAIESSGGKDFVVCDAVHPELQRISARMATLVWRQLLDSPIAGSPIIRAGKLYCATRSGKLMTIDVDSGDVLQSVQLVEPLRSGPALSTDGATIYLATDRGNLIVLSASDLRAGNVTRLGYQSGMVEQPPVEVGKLLVVTERQSLGETKLRVLALGGGGGLKAVQQIPLAGRLDSPPIVESGKLIVATNRGGIQVFATSGPANAPLTKTAESPDDAKGAVQENFVAAQPGRFWVAGKGIAQFDASATGNLRPSWQALRDDTVVLPPSIVGDTVIVATTDGIGRPGVAVKGLSSNDGKTKWETLVAAPLAGPLSSGGDGKSVRIVQPFLGAIEQDLSATGSQQIIAAPRLLLDGKPAPAAVSSVPLADGKAAVVTTQGAGSEQPRMTQVLIADAKTHSVKQVPTVHNVRSMPVVLGDGVLVADRIGQISLIDAKTNDRLAASCLLPLPAGAELKRCWPAVVPGKPEALLTDGAKRVYRVGLKEKSATALSVLAEEPLDKPLNSRFAVLGPLAFASDADGDMRALGVADLKPAKSFPLGANAPWGPYRVGDSVLAATDRELFCFSASPELVWKKPLPDGLPAEGALEQGSDVVLASLTGTVWRVDRKSGETRGKVALEQPLAGAPVAVGKQMVVAAADGTLLVFQGP